MVSFADLRIPVITTAAVLVVALAGTRLTSPGASPWPRFWATAFFAVLLWPVGLVLVRRIFGRTAQRGVAVIIVCLTVTQQGGAGSLPLPLAVRWSVSLAEPGDAIRRNILLPLPGDLAWERAWSTAVRAAVAVCTEERVSEDAAISVSVNGGPATSLSALQRTGMADSVGWYNVPVTRAQVEARRPMEVVVRRDGSSGPPARICGGQDDPTRPGWGGSERLVVGRWLGEQLADIPVPPIAGRPAPSRYYIELRFYDRRSIPHAGIWY